MLWFYYKTIRYFKTSNVLFNIYWYLNPTCLLFTAPLLFSFHLNKHI